MVIIIVFIRRCQIILVKVIFSRGHTYFLYDVVVKVFCRGYVVQICQLIGIGYSNYIAFVVLFALCHSSPRKGATTR